MKYFFGFTDAKDPDIKPCCDIDVTGIFAANHQKAVKEGIDHAKGASNLTITNSALSEDGTKLTSAGEHIVCATLDRVASDDTENSKTRELALEALQWYAKQFSGEALDEKKVYSLQNEGNQDTELQKDEGSKKDEEKPDSTDGDEEIDAAQKKTDEKKKSDNLNEDASADGGENANDPDEARAENFTEPEEENKDQEQKSNSSSSTQPKLGYYFVYKLAIEGIKESSFGDALKKMASKVIDGIDLKAKFTSLFGGGGDELELSGKKARQYFQAKIDPDKLVNNFEDKIRKKFPSEKYGVLDTKIYDKNLMIKTLGNLVSGEDKKRILKSDYSIAIKVPVTSKARDLIKPALIAKLLQKSVREVQPNMKLFKNKIREKDIIVVSNSKASAVKNADDDRLDASKTEEPEGNSVFSESYLHLGRPTTFAKTTMFETINSQQDIFDLLFEDRAGTKKIIIQFKYPSDWVQQTEGRPQDFEPKKVISVDLSGKSIKFGDIKKNNDNDSIVKSATSLASSKFDTEAVFVGWHVKGDKLNKTIDDKTEFEDDTVLVATYKKKTKADGEDDLRGSGKDFDYYVIPMPGLKYPDKEDER